jgi:hypothetical protein
LLLRQDVQDCCRRTCRRDPQGGKEAGAYGRQLESREDTLKLDALEKAGKLKRIPFTERDKLKKLVDPVIEAYAKDIGADQILAKINALK